MTISAVSGQIPGVATSCADERSETWGVLRAHAEGEYLSPSQVASVLHVTPKTVSRWASQGRLPCLVTLGGHRRFRAEDVENILRRMAGKEDVSPVVRSSPD